MKWKLFLRSLSISAPRVTVRSKAPWPLRAFMGFFILAVAAAAGVALYEYGRQFAGPDPRVLMEHIERLKIQLADAKADRDRFAAAAAVYESQIEVGRSAQEKLAQQIAILEAESGRLREDLSFFESLLPTEGVSNAGIVIRSFRVQPETVAGATNELRYRLLVQQSGKPKHDFVGSVQLEINYMQGARRATLHVPGQQEAAHLQLSFRHYQRVEGTFALPTGATAKSVQVRIVSGGKTQVQQSFVL